MQPAPACADKRHYVKLSTPYRGVYQLLLSNVVVTAQRSEIEDDA